jgi:hypothetical protein
MDPNKIRHHNKIYKMNKIAVRKLYKQIKEIIRTVKENKRGFKKSKKLGIKYYRK